MLHIAYQYAKDDGMNPLTAGVMSMGAFLIMVPSTIDMGENGTITAFKSNYLGSDGIFVAIILSILVAMAYGFLTRKNIKVNLPDSVPPMVADSLSPVFTAKSEKFKAMRGLMTIPNIFNINEPVIFGVPVMLNPIFFIPMVLSSLVPGLSCSSASLSPLCCTSPPLRRGRRQATVRNAMAGNVVRKGGARRG